MKRIIFIVIVAIILSIVFLAFFTSCQTCTRRIGGTTKIELEKNQKFLNVTWKDDNIWVLVQEKEKEYKFIEYSNYGIFKGEVIITEK